MQSKKEFLLIKQGKGSSQIIIKIVRASVGETSLRTGSGGSLPAEVETRSWARLGICKNWEIGRSGNSMIWAWRVGIGNAYVKFIFGLDGGVATTRFLQVVLTRIHPASQNERDWDVVFTRVQCELGTSHASKNCFARRYTSFNMRKFGSLIPTLASVNWELHIHVEITSSHCCAGLLHSKTPGKQ